MVNWNTQTTIIIQPEIPTTAILRPSFKLEEFEEIVLKFSKPKLPIGALCVQSHSWALFHFVLQYSNISDLACEKIIVLLACGTLRNRGPKRLMPVLTTAS